MHTKHTHVQWHDDAHTIICQQICHDWTTQEWLHAAQTVVAMAEAQTHKVGVIVDYADDVDMNRVPDGMLHALNDLPKHPLVQEDSIACVAVVGLSGQLALVDRIFQRIHKQRKSVRVNTFEEALQMIEQGLTNI